MKPAKIVNRIKDNLAVWTEFNSLSSKCGAINLSLGSPAVPPPSFLLQNLLELSQNTKVHQYASLWGHPELVAAVSKYYSTQFGRTIKQEEILISPGAMPALFNAIFGLTASPRDEVFTFAPFFPQYFSQTAMADRKFVQSKLKLNPSTLLWEIDFDDLAKKLSAKTKVILLNSPNNPTGKCFSLEEQKELSKIFTERCPQAIIVNDCVYESILFDGKEHVDFATIDDNWRRTITIYSGGKLLSCTGWKIGWSIGPEELIRVCALINDQVTCQTNSVCQLAIAKALYQLDDTPWLGFKNFEQYLISSFQKSRDHLIATLAQGKLPIKPLQAESGYFLMADISKCRDLIGERYWTKDRFADDLKGVVYNEFEERKRPTLDYAFARWLTMEFGVAPLPGSLFYKEGEEQEEFVRFAICQTPEVMEKVREKLK